MLMMLVEILHIILTAAWWIIIIQAVLSWAIAFNVINTRSDIVSTIWTTLDKLTEPLYRPIRRIMPDFGALDLSPMVVLVIVMILDGPVLNYLAQLAVTYS